MVATPLHNIFLRSLYKPESDLQKVMPDYKPRLTGMRHDLIESQRFVLDTKAVWEIVDRSDLDVKHLMDRVQLAHLPFEKVWLEYSQHDKIEANFFAGRGPKPLYDEVANQAGFIMRRLDGRSTAWAAQKIQAANGEILPNHGCDLLTYIFDAESRYPIVSLGGHKTLLKDEVAFEAEVIARTLWGQAALTAENDRMGESLNKGSLALNQFWRSKMNLAKRAPQYAEVIRGVLMEMVGELRFLVTALAVMNEVPIIVSDEVRPPKLTFLAGGRMQPFLSHREVTINVPAIKRMQKSVSTILYEAGSKKRRHKVREHRRVYLNKDGSVKKVVWVPEHERGDASLGWVTHDYAVKGKREKSIL